MSATPVVRAHAGAGAIARAGTLAREALPVTPLLVVFVVVSAAFQAGAGPVRDEQALLAFAERLLDGTYADTVAPVAPRSFLWHGPGLPVVLAPFVALDVPLAVLRLLGAALLGAAIVAFHHLLRARVGPRAAVLWTYALGLYLPFYPVLRAIHKEPLAVLLVVVAMLGLSRGLAADGRRTGLAVAGVALGGLAMVRLEYGWVLVALLALALGWWAARRDAAVARRLAVVAGIGLLVCTPWLTFTSNLTGRHLYWGDSGGLSLYWMAPSGRPGLTGEWFSPYAVPKEPLLAAHRPFFARLGRLSPLARDLELRRVAMRAIRADPLGYARNVAANASRMVLYVPMRPTRPAGAIAVCVVLNGGLLAAVAWAAVRLWRRRRALPPESVPFALLAALSLGIHLPVSAGPRMLLPVVPLLLWFVVQACAVRHAAGPGRAAGCGTPGRR